MTLEFDGALVRLARHFHAFSLEDIAANVGKTRQFLYKVESNQAVPTDDLTAKISDVLAVEPAFFFASGRQRPLAEPDVHFRRLAAAKVSTRQTILARGELFRELANHLETKVRFPAVSLPQVREATDVEGVERAAEVCRRVWGVGVAPISNMVRLAENAGVLVTTFGAASTEVDALSVPGTRPIIVRNLAKPSVCRQRFDIGHELAHLVLHPGRTTGDRMTEAEANRFAGALLVPRSMMAKFFPRPKNGRLDWRALSEFKLHWKISKAAALYRAQQLGLLNEEQFRSGVITLKRTGQAIVESEDHLIEREAPELIERSLQLLRERRGVFERDIASALQVRVGFLDRLLGRQDEGDVGQARPVAAVLPFSRTARIKEASAEQPRNDGTGGPSTPLTLRRVK